MTKINETIKAVEDILAWYYKRNDYNIEQLLSKRDKLAVLSYYLATVMAELKTVYNKSYYTRKIAVSRKKQALILQGCGVGESQVKAETETEQELFTELENEGITYGLENKLRQVNKVLEAFNQRIAYLKDEKKQHLNMT